MKKKDGERIFFYLSFGLYKLIKYYIVNIHINVLKYRNVYIHEFLCLCQSLVGYCVFNALVYN